jgi:predicted MFS family arabinose efflux permease
MSGLLCGVLFGRAVAGVVGDHHGWRAMFWLGCLFAIATGILLAATLPSSRPKSRDSYPELLRSLVTLWQSEPALQCATLIQVCLFGSFSALWTILALQLDANYYLSDRGGRDEPACGPRAGRHREGQRCCHRCRASDWGYRR